MVVMPRDDNHKNLKQPSLTGCPYKYRCKVQIFHPTHIYTLHHPPQYTPDHALSNQYGSDIHLYNTKKKVPNNHNMITINLSANIKSYQKRRNVPFNT